MSCFGKIIVNLDSNSDVITYDCSIVKNGSEEELIISDSMVYGGVCDFYFASEPGIAQYTFSCKNIFTNEVQSFGFELNSNCC